MHKKHREAQGKLQQFAAQYPVVTVTGPRQSGKTTMCRMVFPQHAYVNLEDLDQRNFARSDPRGFLKNLRGPAILDEFQRVPELASYIQGLVDQDAAPGQFILTGSQNLKVSQTVVQSLAGRSAMLTLLPFTVHEAYGKTAPSWMHAVFTGGYPRIHSQELDPTEALGFYLSTYVERDVRSLSQIHDLARFEVFLRLCAGRTGCLLSYSELASDAGVTVNTAKNWISVLEASYIVKRLTPWFANISKRLVKSPKLYFLDSGLACYLMGIHKEEQIATHPLRGQLFETLVVTEAWKHKANRGLPDNIFFYRDSQQREIDLLEDSGVGLQLTEIKSGATIASDWFDSLLWGRKNMPRVISCQLITGGSTQRIQYDVKVKNWFNGWD